MVNTSNSRKSNDMLRHANKDQINAMSEVVLNLLKNNIPLSPVTMAKLRAHRRSLCIIGQRRSSLKKRRQTLQKQKGGQLWKALNTVLLTCCQCGKKV